MNDDSQSASVRSIPGEPLRFHVRSKSNPSETHMVDLGEFNGQGRCDCIRWETTCWPCIRDTGVLPPAKRCRHIKAARELALNLTIAQYLSTRKEQS